MGPADTLSCKDIQDITFDNQDAFIVPDSVIINALDLALSTSIAQSIPSDPLILCILARLKDGTPLFSRSTLFDWHYDNGHLFFKGRMFVSPSSWSALLHAIHSSPLLGHMGIFHTKSILKRDYWWPGLASFVKILLMDVRSVNKTRSTPTPPLHPSVPYCPPPLSAFQAALSQPYHRSSTILGFWFYHGRSQPQPYKGGDSYSLLQNVWHSWNCPTLFWQYIQMLWPSWHPHLWSWSPIRLSIRKGTHPSLEIWRQTLHHLPPSDRQTNWTNQSGTRNLSPHLLHQQPSILGESLSSAEFHHNSAPHSSTKKSPFSILYGYEPHTYPPLGKTFLPALEDRLSSFDETRKEALAAHESARKLMTQRSSHWFVPWKIGDKVWLEVTHLCLHYPSRKLAPKRMGPFEITCVLSSLTYQLNSHIPGKYTTFSTPHFSHLIAPLKHMDHPF